jgi:hypothetical protein
VVPLRSPDSAPLGLLPLTKVIQRLLGVDRATAPVLGFLTLSQAVVELAAEASLPAPVAHVQAEIFGGTGIQAAVGWLDGTIAFGPRFTANHPAEAEDERYEVISDRRATGAPVAMAIDEALQFLGVEAVGSLDEFATVGLGAHRATEDWANAHRNRSSGCP